MSRVYVDMDGVLCNYKKAFNECRIKNPEQPFPQSQFGFWIDLEPIDGAIDGFNHLCKNHDVWILTKPSFDNLNSFSEKAYWVNKYFGPNILRKLIMSRDKSLLLGNYLIDDTTDTANQLDFQGKFIHFGSVEFPNWAEILKFFNGKKFQVGQIVENTYLKKSNYNSWGDIIKINDDDTADVNVWNFGGIGFDRKFKVPLDQLKLLSL